MTAQQLKQFIESHDGCELIKDCGEFLIVRSQYTQQWADSSVTLHYMIETIQRIDVKRWLGY